MTYNIIDVLKDAITGELEFVTQEVADQRMAICNGCDAQVAGICTACGCVLLAKTKLIKSECPMELW